MNNIQKRRFYYVIFFILGLALASGLILYALRQNINIFLTPTELSEKRIASDYPIRLGGMVKLHSLVHTGKNLALTFVVTDFKHDIPVYYDGILPDLFREGKGVIATGHMNAQGIFIANEVLAKHDENYMPKKVYDALRKKAHA